MPNIITFIEIVKAIESKLSLTMTPLLLYNSLLNPTARQEHSN